MAHASGLGIVANSCGCATAGRTFVISRAAGVVPGEARAIFAATFYRAREPRRIEWHFLLAFAQFQRPPPVS